MVLQGREYSKLGSPYLCCACALKNGAAYAYRVNHIFGAGGWGSAADLCQKNLTELHSSFLRSNRFPQSFRKLAKCNQNLSYGQYDEIE